MAEQSERPDEKSGSKAKAGERTYGVERLVVDSDGLLGVASHVAAGGLYGVEGEITVAEAKARIEKWLATPAS